MAGGAALPSQENVAGNGPLGFVLQKPIIALETLTTA